MARHKHWWSFPAVVVAALGMFGAGVWQSLDRSCQAVDTSNDAIRITHGFDAKIEKQAQKVEDNWESSQRQLTGIRGDIGEVKQSIKESNKAVMQELKENRAVMMQAVKGKQNP